MNKFAEEFEKEHDEFVAKLSDKIEDYLKGTLRNILKEYPDLDLKIDCTFKMFSWVLDDEILKLNGMGDYTDEEGYRYPFNEQLLEAVRTYNYIVRDIGFEFGTVLKKEDL